MKLDRQETTMKENRRERVGGKGDGGCKGLLSPIFMAAQLPGMKATYVPGLVTIHPGV